MMYGEHVGTLVDARHDQQLQSDDTSQTDWLTVFQTKLHFNSVSHARPSKPHLLLISIACSGVVRLWVGDTVLFSPVWLDWTSDPSDPSSSIQQHNGPIHVPLATLPLIRERWGDFVNNNSYTLQYKHIYTLFISSIRYLASILALALLYNSLN